MAAPSPAVGVGGSDGDLGVRGARINRDGHLVCFNGHVVAGGGRIESGDLGAVHLEGVQQGRQVVGEELRAVAGLDDPDGLSVAGDGSGIVVVREGGKVERGSAVAGGQVVGVHQRRVAVYHPGRHPVGPHPDRAGIGRAGGVEFPAVDTGSVALVGVQLFVPLVGNPEDLAVGPDVTGLGVSEVGVEVLVAVTVPVRQRVGVDVGVVVGHPHGGPVGPEAAGVGVGGVEVKVLVAVAGPGKQRVGVDLVVGLVGHPHGGPVGPRAGGVLVPRVGEAGEFAIDPPAEVGVGAPVDGDRVLAEGLVVEGHADGHLVGAYGEVELEALGLVVGVGHGVGHGEPGVRGRRRDGDPRHGVGHAHLVAGLTGVEADDVPRRHSQSTQTGVDVGVEGVDLVGGGSRHPNGGDVAPQVGRPGDRDAPRGVSFEVLAGVACPRWTA